MVNVTNSFMIESHIVTLWDNSRKYIANITLYTPEIQIVFFTISSLLKATILKYDNKASFTLIGEGIQ